MGKVSTHQRTERATKLTLAIDLHCMVCIITTKLYPILPQITPTIPYFPILYHRLVLYGVIWNNMGYNFWKYTPKAQERHKVDNSHGLIARICQCCHRPMTAFPKKTSDVEWHTRWQCPLARVVRRCECFHRPMATKKEKKEWINLERHTRWQWPLARVARCCECFHRPMTGKSSYKSSRQDTDSSKCLSSWSSLCHVDFTSEQSLLQVVCVLSTRFVRQLIRSLFH